MSFSELLSTNYEIYVKLKDTDLNKKELEMAFRMITNRECHPYNVFGDPDSIAIDFSSDKASWDVKWLIDLFNTDIDGV